MYTILCLQFIDALEASDCQAVANLKQLMADRGSYIEQDIIHIHSSYGFLVESITKLESNSISMAESIVIVENTYNKIKSISCTSGKIIYQQFHDNLLKSPDYDKLKIINNVINGLNQEIPENLEMFKSNFEYYKMCTLTSCEVERTFSRYKNINRDDRSSFSFENLKKHVIINCNARIYND